MVWKKILNCHSIGFGTFLLVFVFALFFSFFLNIHNSFAIDDVVYNLDRPDSGSYTTTFCSTNVSSVPSCSDFSYVIFSATSDSAGYFVLNSFTSFRLPNFSDTILSISSNAFRNSYLSFQFHATSSLRSLTVTLTDTFPSDCPVCEECQECPAIPENPYDDKFDKIIVAIYTCGAILLIIYFFYCIYGMIIKSTGGK